MVLSEGTVIRKVSIITIIAVVVVSLAIVAIARYQRTVYPTVVRGLSVATGNNRPQTEYVINIVRREVPSLGIKYPVVTDNNYQTWKAYAVEAWPTIFLVDKHGRIRWKHVGEGRYEETHGAIKALLAE